MKVTHIGVDLAKRVFSVCGLDGRGRKVISRDLRRAELRPWFAQLEPCIVGMEACASAHYWARELSELGHTVRLMNPRFVKPYRLSDKNDRNDAAAICEALTRPSMRFVAVKSVEQQAVLTMHRTRALLGEQRKALMNSMRGLLGEFGITVQQGVLPLRKRLPEILEDAENALPALARECFAEMHERWLDLEQRLTAYDRRLAQLSRESEPARRLMGVPGIGPITATALIATAGDLRDFDNGRQFAAWLGLVPRHYASGGVTRYGRITKRGDAYVRMLLVHGARAALRTAAKRCDPVSRWALEVKKRRGANKAAVALAAKNARMIWALLARGSDYAPLPAAA